MRLAATVCGLNDLLLGAVAIGNHGSGEMEV